MAEDGTSTKLSPQALALYQRMLEDATLIKRQQWSLTNYVALITQRLFGLLAIGQLHQRLRARWWL
jgi:hypothetical protein